VSAAAADERHCENELIRSRDEHRARLSGITLRRRVDFNFKPRRRPSHGGALRIAILLIASVLIGSLVAAQGPLKTDPPVIVQMSYYAQQARRTRCFGFV
jgi:hypothetical protein